MPETSERVEFENQFVKVVRVTMEGLGKRQVESRGPRVVISLTDEIETRTEHNGRQEQIQRKVGDVVFRDASPGHTIENGSPDRHEVIIVELKT
jgi:hypothetical protein